MKIGLYAAMDNGCVRDRSIPYIAVDRGLSHLARQNIQPIIAIGDFDSLEQKELLKALKVDRYPVMKDDTDTALAVEYALDHGYDEIDIYGVIGARLDHFMAALKLLEKYQNVKITIYDETNQITLLKSGVHHIHVTHHYFSVFALKDTIITLENALYPLDHYTLKQNDPLCVSNQATGELIITNSEPVLYFEADDS